MIFFIGLKSTPVPPEKAVRDFMSTNFLYAQKNKKNRYEGFGNAL